MTNKNEEFLEETKKLMESIQETDLSIIIALELSCYISSCLDNEWISLYEAYLLNIEVISLTRGSGKCGWEKRVYILDCLKILNQRMLALLYGDLQYAEKMKEFALEAFKLNDEKREHFILDDYVSYIDAHTDKGLLKKLEYARENWEQLLDDDYDSGPFPIESFPMNIVS